ncbi:MAG TPA: Sir2 family NAD+-dependent deacetylase [Candidatus Ozemobacteraceae bacterium]
MSRKGLDGKARIVVLTGAGISKESGLDTFRDAGGVWERYRIEDVATPEGYVRNPAKVHRFYNEQRIQLGEVQPNAAHFALARLEKEVGDRLLVVTQNIDDLHERAGSTRLIHMHGELLKVRCEHCEAIRAETGSISTDTVCASCGRKGGVRPHIVWFGEIPLRMDEIFAALDRCSLFVAIGTSGNVYPAAGFVERARMNEGTRTLELNLEPSVGASRFAETVYGPATEVVPAWVDRLLGTAGGEP